jgi:hypothetical protein
LRVRAPWWGSTFKPRAGERSESSIAHAPTPLSATCSDMPLPSPQIRLSTVPGFQPSISSRSPALSRHSIPDESASRSSLPGAKRIHRSVTPFKRHRSKRISPTLERGAQHSHPAIYAVSSPIYCCEPPIRTVAKIPQGSTRSLFAQGIPSAYRASTISHERIARGRKFYEIFSNRDEFFDIPRAGAYIKDPFSG